MLGDIDLRSLADKLRKIPTADIDEVAKLAGTEWDADLRPLRIMVSSPVKDLSEERDAIKKVLTPYSNLDTQLFEKMADSGHSNVRESMDLALRCELVIAILDPQNPGSEIPDASRPASYEHIRYYSELELQIALDRNAKTRVPLIFIYVKHAGPEMPELQAWHKRFANQIAPKAFATTEELINRVYLDVFCNVIELRSSRARYLSKELRNTMLQLAVEQNRVETKLQQIATLESARGNLQEQYAALERASSTARKDLIDNHQQIAEVLSQEVSRVSNQLKSQDKRALNLMSVGGMMTGVPILLLAVLLIGWYVFGGTNEAIRNSGHMMASAAAYRPMHINGIPYDPMGVAAKIAFARELTNGEFTCDGPWRREWGVTLDPAMKVIIDRDSVCLSTREVVLARTEDSFENCDFEPPINADWWRKVVKAADSAHLSIDEARLVGHASIPFVRSRCKVPMPRDLFDKIPKSTLADLEIKDIHIKTNAQLAYVRAKLLELELLRAGVNARAETLGILNAQSADDQSRRVTVALRLLPQNQRAVATQTLSAR